MEWHLLCMTERSIRAWSLDDVKLSRPMRETSVHQNLAHLLNFGALLQRVSFGPWSSALKSIKKRAAKWSQRLQGGDKGKGTSSSGSTTASASQAKLVPLIVSKQDRPGEVASSSGCRTVSEMAAFTSEIFTWPKRT